MSLWLLGMTGNDGQRLQSTVVKIRHSGQRRRSVIQNLLVENVSVYVVSFILAVSRFLMSLWLLGMTGNDGQRLQSTVVKIRHSGQRRRSVIQNLLVEHAIVYVVSFILAMRRFLMPLWLLGMTGNDGQRLQSTVVKIRHSGQRRRSVIQNLLVENVSV
ncbi:hypothetical protein [Vibrio alginolyticus]|uniref:hypothetical protein n=2 Tax=Vibrio alginolyticus TaxID=663 RepID=UPI000E05B8BE|nr:hypothetical protein [Vibrio alginolyticus]WED60064.1 hypothetical protein O6P42_02815 [Vibrio alginolyticus]SUP22217.1 Uncharacterised protein [Vibrio alginolyticus]